MSSNPLLTTRINARYSAAAARATTHTHSDPSSTAIAIASAFGYTVSELTSLPPGANMGLSCGVSPLVRITRGDYISEPTSHRFPHSGETVVDLGSGGGFDVFIAARRVGPSGRAIGVDQNPDMLALAERNRMVGGYGNVEFIEAPITRISQLEDGVADCVVSNCVVNLVPAAEKHLVFKEMYRLLKPRGRVAVSDLCAKRSLPEEMRRDIVAWVGCIAGAALVEEYEGWLMGAGFGEVVVVDALQDCNQYKRCGVRDTEGAGGGCCSAGVPPTKEETSSPGPGETEEAPKMRKSVLDADLNEWIGSFKIFAVKK